MRADLMIEGLESAERYAGDHAGGEGVAQSAERARLALYGLRGWLKACNRDKQRDRALKIISMIIDGREVAS